LEQKIVLHDSDNKSKIRRRKSKEVLFGRIEDSICPNPKTNKLVEEKKPEKEEILVSAKVKADSKMQEAQGPDEGPKEDIRMEDSSWISSVPVPPRPMAMALTEKLVSISKPLAAKDIEDDKM
jgi:hypothetical protein